MKKLALITAIVLAFALVGCGTGGGRGALDRPPFEVDLSTMIVVPEIDNAPYLPGAFVGTRNVAPLTRAWRWYVVLFGEGSLPDYITDFQRVTVTTRYFGEGGVEIEPGDGNMQMAMFYDIEGDLHTDHNPNLIFKEMNTMGFSGTVCRDRGVRVRMRAPPVGLVLQASNNYVRYIEVTRVIFHNDRAGLE